MYVNIENKNGLIRDISTGAVLNVNRTEYENYINRKKQAELEKEQASAQAEEINNLKNEISEIKQMLIALTNK
jgi:wobble nucleotide-excising tRNase